MFTGIVTDVGIITQINKKTSASDSEVQLVIETNYHLQKKSDDDPDNNSDNNNSSKDNIYPQLNSPHLQSDIGKSICCNGVCLTVTDIENNKTNKIHRKNTFSCYASSHTVKKTNVKFWKKQQKINLERAMKLNDEIGGHIITGHVDGIALLTKIDMIGDSQVWRVKLPQNEGKLCVDKGSIAINGVSLTINKVHDDEIYLNIIPHTIQYTNLQFAKINDYLNYETDIVSKYVSKRIKDLQL